MKKTTMTLVLFMTLLMCNIHASEPTEIVFTLESSSTCLAPSHLSKSRIAKNNSIVISWDHSCPIPEKYELLVESKGKRSVLSSTILTRFTYSDSITVSRLNKNEFFNAYVRSVYGDSNELVSNWNEKMQFRTYSSNDKIGDSITDKLLEDSFKIYPNPATSKFKLQGPDVDTIELYNILGSKVLEVRNTNSVNVSNLNSGAYLVKITAKNISVTKKLIITQ